MWIFINKARRLLRLGILKTLFFNFYMLPFKQAIYLPILFSRKTHFFDLSGETQIEGPISFGMIRFGYFGEDTNVAKDFNTLLKLKGKIIFMGSSHFGIGLTLRIEQNAILKVGNNVRISNLTKIICYENIQIGDNCRIAWECQIIDTTFHYIRNKTTMQHANLNDPIKIGHNNWIGNRTNIMKGTFTPDFCIIAGGSLCNKKLDIPPHSLIAGTPAKLIKTEVYRVLEEEEEEIKKSSNSK